MFARWYSLFLGLLLIVLGIAGLVAAHTLPGPQPGLVATSIIWLLTAVVSLWIGASVRNLSLVRTTSGIISGLYFLWGIVLLFVSTAANSLAGMASVATGGAFILMLGALGLAAALVPTTWLREPTPTMA